MFTCSSRLIARCRLGVRLFVHGLAPFVGLLGTGDFKRDVLEPEIRRGAVPVLDVRRNVYRVAFLEGKG